MGYGFRCDEVFDRSGGIAPRQRGPKHAAWRQLECRQCGNGQFSTHVPRTLMPDSTISALTAAAALDGSEALPIAQATSTVRTTTQAVADLALSAINVVS